MAERSAPYLQAVSQRGKLVFAGQLVMKCDLCIDSCLRMDLWTVEEAWIAGGAKPIHSKAEEPWKLHCSDLHENDGEDDVAERSIGK